LSETLISFIAKLFLKNKFFDLTYSTKGVILCYLRDWLWGDENQVALLVKT